MPINDGPCPGIDSAKETFIGDFELAGQIDDQNQRASQIEESISDTDIKNLALEGVSKEQTTLVEELRDNVNPELYRSFGAYQLRLTELDTQIDEQIQQIVDNEKQRIESEANLAAELSPLSRPLIVELAEEKKALADESVEDSIAELLATKQKVTSKIEEINGLSEIISQPWPVPTVIGRAVVSLDSEKTIISQETIDEIPVKPEPKSKESAHEKIKNRYSEITPDASHFAAYYLSENAGKVITVKELADFMYDTEINDTVSRYNLRARVTTILGPKVGGKVIAEMLAEENLLLQYGWRTTRTVFEDGSKQTNRKRIYRAIPYQEFGEQHLVDEVSNGQTDKWQTPHVPEKLTAQPKKAKASTSVVPKTRSRIQAKTPVVPQSAVETRTNGWEEGFRAEVRQVIAHLEELGLLSEEREVSLVGLRHRSPHKTIGTKTAVNRLRHAGILTRDQAKLSVIPLDVVVAMHLFNSHRTLLEKGPRQQKALKAIKASLDNYFAKKARATQRNS